jgi:hypothetical protein
MPNWVYNRVVVTGDQDMLDKIEASVRVDSNDERENTEFSYQGIIPRPPEAEEDWYSFNNLNWGTKWDASDVTTDHSPGSLAYRFSSPWAPPVPVLTKLASLYPDVVVNHVFEEEQGWGGELSYQADAISKIRDWEIPNTHAEIDTRGGECYCEEDQAYYEDCFSFLAAQRTDLTNAAREAAVALGNGWSGTFPELIEAAKRL